MPQNKKPSLRAKLVDVMKAVEHVPKRGHNAYHNYPYALEADIISAVRQKLAELGVLVITSVNKAQRTGDITEVFTEHSFIDADTGETLAVRGYGQGAAKDDKGGYKAITGAMKYFLMKNFLIPTGDDPEKADPQMRDKPASSQEQQREIQQLAKALGLDVQKDILDKMEITWPPSGYDANRILKRLREMKKERVAAAGRDGSR